VEDDAPSPQIERLPERDPSSASQSTRAKPQVAVRLFRWALPRPLPRRRPCRPAPRPSALRPAGYPASGLCPVGAGSAPAASRLSPSPTILHAIGAHGRIRTCDTSFRKRVLYPLSYVGGTLDCTPTGSEPWAPAPHGPARNRRRGDTRPLVAAPARNTSRTEVRAEHLRSAGGERRRPMHEEVQ
jgi:hypothetical protein